MVPWTWHAACAEHLLRLLDLCDPHDRGLGLKTLNMDVIIEELNTPERFFCASEHAAVVPIPSLTSSHPPKRSTPASCSAPEPPA